MDPTINHNIKNIINKATNILENWENNERMLIEKKKLTHDENIKQMTENSFNLENKRTELIKTIEQSKEYKIEQENLLQMLIHNISCVKENQQALQSKVNEQNEIVKSLKQEIEQGQSECQQRNKKSTSHLQKTLDDIEFFHKYLGLSCNNENGGLKIKLQNIDPNDPEREFYFIIFLNGQDNYQIRECSPNVNNIDEYLEELNLTNDLSFFVRNIRKQFKTMCTD
eukprot:TRINITY_DN2187_c0_g1_i1.p1 TRINITY_DN2187_c0_g1~~TRINITY_DN2187_c0_g1_i1.p1  ORF type:complete len:226 (-),score=46.56 TRINITY_DN2187_c0_g1_i1:247-924(-)